MSSIDIQSSGSQRIFSTRLTRLARLQRIQKALWVSEKALVRIYRRPKKPATCFATVALLAACAGRAAPSPLCYARA